MQQIETDKAAITIPTAGSSNENEAVRHHATTTVTALVVRKGPDALKALEMGGLTSSLWLKNGAPAAQEAEIWRRHPLSGLVVELGGERYEDAEAKTIKVEPQPDLSLLLTIKFQLPLESQERFPALWRLHDRGEVPLKFYPKQGSLIE